MYKFRVAVDTFKCSGTFTLSRLTVHGAQFSLFTRHELNGLRNQLQSSWQRDGFCASAAKGQRTSYKWITGMGCWCEHLNGNVDCRPLIQTLRCTPSMKLTFSFPFNLSSRPAAKSESCLPLSPLNPVNPISNLSSICFIARFSTKIRFLDSVYTRWKYNREQIERITMKNRRRFAVSCK